MHKKSGSETASFPQSEKKVTSGTSLLFDKLSYHHFKDKLINSDQKVIPDYQYLDCRADLNMEIK